MPPSAPATISESAPGEWALAGSWTVAGLGRLPHTLLTLAAQSGALVLDGSALGAVDSAGAWVLKRWLGTHQATASLRGWPARWQTLMTLVLAQTAPPVQPVPHASTLEAVGRRAEGRLAGLAL